MFWFDKEKVVKIGCTILGASCVFALALVLVFEKLTLQEFPSLGARLLGEKEHESLVIPFNFIEREIAFPMPKIEEELSFSQERLRPDVEKKGDEKFFLHLRKSGIVKTLTLPARVDFRYDKGLCFSQNEGAFWAHFEPSYSGVFVSVFVLDTKKIEKKVGSFEMESEEVPFRSANDFQEGSALRKLAESKFLGNDLFLSKYEKKKIARLELGEKELLSLKEGDFLVWKDARWEKIQNLRDAKDLTLARVCSCDEKRLLIETWGLDEYSRLCISSFPGTGFKTKTEEIISSVRIRSEKQISCMLEKQCFVLKMGDWVLKADNRWRVLRKQEEKDAFVQGDLEGEIFVFDRIDQKGGQKVLHGSLFDAGRSQMLPIEYIASVKKQKGKTR